MGRRRTPPPRLVAAIEATARMRPRYSGGSGRFLTALAESATATLAAPTARTSVREVAAVVEAPTAAKPGRMRIRLIRAGWSLNDAYYSREVLRRDGPRAWSAGKTLCYIDHAPDAEEQAYPSGSVKNLAAVLTTDAQWNDETQSLEAEVRLFAPWREAITDMAEHIGMSIRAWVYAEEGEAEGRKGTIVTSIAEGRSVDFVTVPAAGGAILSVLESARHRAAEARNIGGWLESRLHLALTTYADDMYGDGRLTRDERIVLSGAIGDGLQAWTARVEADAPQLFQRDLWTYPEPATTGTEEARRAAEATAEETRSALQRAVTSAHGGDDGTWIWVRDYDPDRGVVWFETSSDSESATWEQAYTADDAGVTLTGDRVAVTPRVVYDPAFPRDDEGDTEVDDAAEAAASTPPADEAGTPDVTDGAPPTGSTQPPEEDPDMSGTQTGAPPVPAGAAPVVDAPPTQTAEATTGANTAVVEALTALTAQLTRLSESQASLQARLDASEAQNRTVRNQHTAREAVTAALSGDAVPGDLRAQIAPRVTATVLANIPTTDVGDVDTVALGEAITAAVAAESTYAATLLESRGVGMPRGLGESTAPQTGDEFVKSLEESFVKLGMAPAAAKIAATGRG